MYLQLDLHVCSACNSKCTELIIISKTCLTTTDTAVQERDRDTCTSTSITVNYINNVKLCLVVRYGMMLCLV